jgi:hypothetical protein
VTDEPSRDDTISGPPGADTPGTTSGRPIDPRYAQRNFAERLFPGPSRQMSEQFAKHVEGLLKDGGNDEALKAWRDRQAKRSANVGGNRGKRGNPGAVEAPAPPAAQEPTPSTPDELAEVSEKLDQQNELLRAILASTVDTQADARSTAQNSRTFAWAGTAIALLTLIATVISIVAAVQGH